MELQNQTAAAFSSTTTSRPLADFHPNVWGNTFLFHISDPNGPQTKAQKEKLVEELKGELRRELKELTANHDYIRQIKMVDAIQRLGIAYHFEDEIDQILQNLFGKFDDYCSKDKNHDMYATALSFRLLRQHGYRVSCKIFDKFKDEKGEFKVSDVPDDDDMICGTAMGMLEFYEATHLRIHDEDVLEHGFVFARNHLESMLPHLSNTTTTSHAVAEQVNHALNGYSNRRGLPRLEARIYISIYANHASHHQGLLRLAKLDFNLLQSLHKREVSEIYRWWKSLDVERKLPYIRDRIVETYFWILGVYFEPQYSVARNILSRLQAIASIFDDTYDAYATFQELQIFTQAIERWDISCLDELPEYMQVIYSALLEVFQEIENEQVVRQGGSYRIPYAKEAMKELARNYLEEAKWREEKYKPTMEEYMRLATKSCGYTSLLIISFLGINGDIARKEAFDWVLSEPDMVKSTLIICRLTDDMVGHEFERKRDHIPSAVECYMNEHNVSEEETIAKFNSQIEMAWKNLNQGFLKPTEIPVPILYRILNFARVIEVMYKKGDWYTNVGPEMQSYIKQLLIDPVPE